MRLSRLIQRLSPRTACAAWIAVCFSLASAAWLSWEYRLIALVGVKVADWWSMVAGYLAQAAGVGGVALLLRREDAPNLNRAFWGTAGGLLAATALAVFCETPGGCVAFGMALNLLCGAMAGFYLYVPAAGLDAGQRSMAFGGGYAASVVAVWLLSMPAGGRALRSPWILLPYAVLAALAVAGTLSRPIPQPPNPSGEGVEPPQPLAGRDLALLGVTALLLSLVKNLGYSFPSADVETGLNLELSRVFYAVGLAAAGYIGDRSRRDGAICTAAALAIPFIMLALAREPVPRFICWALNYLFFGFFSVYRVVLFMDAAARTRRWVLAPLGLLFGRLGDALGTGLCIALTGRTIAIVAVAAALFIAAILLFFRTYRLLYEQPAAPQRTEREVFEAFSQRHDLSAREREVLRLLLAERSNGEIAEALFVSESTVKYHVHNLLKKTGGKTRADLLRMYNAALFPGLEER